MLCYSVCVSVCLSGLVRGFVCLFVLQNHVSKFAAGNQEPVAVDAEKAEAILDLFSILLYVRSARNLLKGGETQRELREEEEEEEEEEDKK
ncbi:hypothetical protein E2C01_054096 [Portunus trituberculatus]|uniref:Uncharacterized protein n=1 Tax=Portunus trituberculatus TaxID=210409 RepID=A0A5B7GID5_PORTR|nr:hypothetical protein [Portunus trituberculatus]